MNKCYIIAGPNGAGKTTLAKELLPVELECLNFVNADLIAYGLSPFKPEKTALKAGRLMLQQIDECVEKKESFAFETTLSGKGYLEKIKTWKTLGYEITIYYLMLPSVKLAVERVKLRKALGGHSVPEKDIIRKFDRSRGNFENLYKPITDNWILFDVSGNIPIIKEQSRYALLEMQALQRACIKAKQEAHRDNLKIPVWENNTIVYK